jgi:hypothetical protein
MFERILSRKFLKVHKGTLYEVVPIAIFAMTSFHPAPDGDELPSLRFTA